MYIYYLAKEKMGLLCSIKAKHTVLFMYSDILAVYLRDVK